MGGYQYGTLAETSSEFTLEAGVSGEADRHINGQPAGPNGPRIEFGPEANVAVSATLAREVENSVLKATQTVYMDIDVRQAYRSGSDGISDIPAGISKVQVIGPFKSVYIGFTTNGSHGEKSLHYAGFAADISRLDGVRMTDLMKTSAGRSKIQALQDAIGRVSDRRTSVYENFGPIYIWKDVLKGRALTDKQVQKLAAQHADHVHISVRLLP